MHTSGHWQGAWFLLYASMGHEFVSPTNHKVKTGQEVIESRYCAGIIMQVGVDCKLSDFFLIQKSHT